jgi:uncharacterized lipoprotein YajG
MRVFLFLIAASFLLAGCGGSSDTVVDEPVTSLQSDESTQMILSPGETIPPRAFTIDR